MLPGRAGGAGAWRMLGPMCGLSSTCRALRGVSVYGIGKSIGHYFFPTLMISAAMPILATGPTGPNRCARPAMVPTAMACHTVSTRGPRHRSHRASGCRVRSVHLEPLVSVCLAVASQPLARNSVPEQWDRRRSVPLPAGYNAEFSLIAAPLGCSSCLSASPLTHCRRAAVKDSGVLRRRGAR